MTKKTLLSAILCSFLFSISFVYEAFSQTETAPPPPPPPPVPVRAEATGVGFGSGGGGPVKRAPGATVRGRLVYEDTGAPIRYAKVSFVTSGQRSPGIEYVSTDENGEFEIKDVPAGEYYPTIKDRGVINPDVIYSLGLPSEETGPKLEGLFQKFSVAGLGEFRFLVRARRGASVTGAITFFDGEPAVGVPVQLIPSNGKKEAPISVRRISQGPFSVETDDRGVYRFAGIPEGNYVVKVTEPVSHQDRSGGTQISVGLTAQLGGNPFETFFPNSSALANAEVLQVFYGQTTEGINVTLPERILYDISGSVIDKNTRRPLKNFRITFHPVPENQEDGEAASASTKSISKLIGFVDSSMGRYNYGEDLPAEWAIQNLPRGKYIVTATQSLSYRDVENKNSKVVRYPAVSKEIEIGNGNIENILFEIPTGVTFSGKIVYEDGSELDRRVSIFAFNEETGELVMPNFGRANATTKPEGPLGSFELGPVQAGKYLLSVTNPDSYIVSINAGRMSTDGDIIEIEEGKDITDARIVLSKNLGVLRGRVTDYVAGTKALVVLVKPDQDIISTLMMGMSTRLSEVKGDGSYEIKAQPGTYSVIVVKRDAMSESESDLIQWLERQKETAPKVELAAKQIRTFDLLMPQ